MYQNNGVIVKGIGGLYRVACEGRIFSCKPRGIFRKDGKKPMIGDCVLLSDFNDKENTAVISELLERKNSLIRPAVANVDRIILVVAAEYPAPDLMLVDKLLVFANKKNISVLLVINKSDRNPEMAGSLYNAYKDAVSECICTSAENGMGIKQLLESVRNGISVLAGQSGTGKSSLSNILVDKAVCPDENTGVNIKTGDLSKKTERGRHTTRHSEFFAVKGAENAYIIDSPGFSLFDLTDVESDRLQYYYPEMKSIIGCCRFQNCSHTGEPGCELSRKSAIDIGRYSRYKEIYRDILNKEKKKYSSKRI